MPRVDVVPAEKGGKFKVLVNFIQKGAEYSTKEIADNQAKLVRERLERGLI